MSRLNDKFFMIDNRNRDDIIKEITDIAKSYVPEWAFHLEDMDIGSVIAYIYANMLEDDINKLNMIMYKYRVELMNMIGLTLKPAQPAKSVVRFSLLPNVDEGSYVTNNTKLLANGPNGHKIVFETQNGVYVTGSSLSDIYSTSRHKGKIIKILDSSNQSKLTSFYMFDFLQNEIQRNEVIIGHDYALNLSKNAVLSIYLSVNEDMYKNPAEELANTQKYEWKYLTSDGYVNFNDVEYRDSSILLRKDSDSVALEYDGDIQYYISVEKKDDIIEHQININEIKISSYGMDIIPEIIYQDDSQSDVREFYPFGDKLTAYSECYIASNNALSKKNAKVTFDFNLRYIKNIIDLEYINNTDYKIIMKKPQTTNYAMSECKVDSIIFEYFNGIGWAKLNIDNKNCSGIFSGNFEGDVSLEFVCPDDISPIDVHAYNKYWIRVRVLKADNCYRVPCEHLIPVISDARFSYKYEGHGVKPKKIIRYSGVDIDNITEQIFENKKCELFKQIDYDKNSIFLGFNKKFFGAPISMYFDIEGGFSKETDYINFEYSSVGDKNSFKPLKVIDETENFKHSGIIMFIPPTDFVKHNLFGKDRYWIKIVDSQNEFSNNNVQCIKVNDIILNAVSVKNIETKAPEIFYIDRSEPDMTINLSHDNILYADVFVNEVDRLSIQQMNDMKEKDSSIQSECDFNGNYISFFIKWFEVDTFIKSGPNDRHYILDRTKGVVIFGNGTKGMIPQKQIRPAIKVYSSICNGKEGNVSVGEINKTDVIINFVNGTYNPVPAYMGYDMENVERALQRGANILSNYGRLISEEDFENEVKNYSDAISMVRCISGVNEYGKKDDKCITIAVLMKEFEKSSEVFPNIKNEIRDIIISKCEMSLSKSCLNIIQPLFVKISVSVWVTVSDHNIVFDVKQEIFRLLTEFIDPINGNFGSVGWEIGKLPRQVQIYSFLKSQNIKGTIEKIILTGKIQSINGVVEREIGDMEKYPFAIGINGQHEILVDYSDL